MTNTLSIDDTVVLNAIWNGISIRDIQKMLEKKSHRTIYARMLRLHKEGFLISPEERGMKGKANAWRLTEEGYNYLKERNLLGQPAAV